MSKITELRAELDRVESAGKELESLEKTKGELVAVLDSQAKLLAQARDAYNKLVTVYAEVMLKAQEVDERGKELSRITGQPWQGIDLARKYGYLGNLTAVDHAKHRTGLLAIHESLVPAVMGGDVLELLKQKRAGK